MGGCLSEVSIQPRICKDLSLTRKLICVSVQTPWTRSAKAGITKALEGLGDLDRTVLSEVGIYREKLEAYLKGQHIPHSINLLAALARFRLPLEIIDPDTGLTLILRFDHLEDQMSLPLPPGVDTDSASRRT